MKILLISDTHNYVNNLTELLPRYSQEVGLVIHLGDYANDLMRFQSKYPHLNMIALDGGYDNGFETERILTLPVASEVEVKILAVHGHLHGVKTNLQRLSYYAQEKQVNVCFFGHTHTSIIFEEQGIFFMNPGSLTFPRNSRTGSYGIVELSSEGMITGEIIGVN